MARMSDILKELKEREKKKEAFAPPPSPQPSPEKNQQSKDRTPVLESLKEKKAKALPTQSGDAQLLPKQEIKAETLSIMPKEKAEGEKKTEETGESGSRLFQFVRSESNPLSREEAAALYRSTAALIKGIYDKVKSGKEINGEDRNILPYVEKFIVQQYLGNEDILDLTNLPLSPKEDFIYTHVLNVCIISVDIGIGLGYKKNRLVELGLATILHDIGMAKFYDLYSKPRRLNEKKYEQIKNHPAMGAEILKSFKNIFKGYGDVILQEHERVDGSGYPGGLKGNSIGEYAKIEILADVYEAMTHPRPYRPKMSPTEAMKQILEAKDTFEKKVLKIFIIRFGCPFPLGSFVKLSSGERGKVIRRNIESPLRPLIEIADDGILQNGASPKTIDLSKYPTIYIKRSLSSEEKPR